MVSIVGKALRGFGRALKGKSKSNWIKGGPKKLGSIVGVKPGSGKVPWHVGAGKNLKDRSRIVKTDRRVKTIDAIRDAEKKIKQGTAELKKLRTTGWTKSPHGKRGRKSYYPKDEGKAAHMVGKKKYKKPHHEKLGVSKKDYDDIPF